MVQQVGICFILKLSNSQRVCPDFLLLGLTKALLLVDVVPAGVTNQRHRLETNGTVVIRLVSGFFDVFVWDI